MHAILITGNTYPVRDRLRELGGTWDAVAKGWRVPSAKAIQAQALVRSAPVEPRRAKRSIGRIPQTSRGYWACPCGEESPMSQSHCWECGLGRRR